MPECRFTVRLDPGSHNPQHQGDQFTVVIEPPLSVGALSRYPSAARPFTPATARAISNSVASEEKAQRHLRRSRTMHKALSRSLCGARTAAPPIAIFIFRCLRLFRCRRSRSRSVAKTASGSIIRSEIRAPIATRKLAPHWKCLIKRAAFSTLPFTPVCARPWKWRLKKRLLDIRHTPRDAPANASAKGMPTQLPSLQLLGMSPSQLRIPFQTVAAA